MRQKGKMRGKGKGENEGYTIEKASINHRETIDKPSIERNELHNKKADI